MKARWDGELEYGIEWGGHDTSPPISVSPEGTLSLISLLDYEDQSRFSLVVTATPLDQPELATTTIVIVEVRIFFNFSI